jgi:hypothetical protein
MSICLIGYANMCSMWQVKGIRPRRQFIGSIGKRVGSLFVSKFPDGRKMCGICVVKLLLLQRGSKLSVLWPHVTDSHHTDIPT